MTNTKVGCTQTARLLQKSGKRTVQGVLPEKILGREGGEGMNDTERKWEMKGYKGFNPGLICKDKQYQENTVFEEPEAKICEKGMHFCKNPFDVLDYYDLICSDGTPNEFTEVETLDEPKTDDQKKFCSRKLKIGVKLGLSGFIKACVDFVLEKTIAERPSENVGSGDYARIGSSGNSARIGSSGYSARIGGSGDSAKIGSSGDYAQIGSSGNYARIGSTGYCAKIGSSGDCVQIGSSGDSAKIGSSGDYAQIGSSGNYARIGSTGDCAKIGSSGDCVQIGSSGYSAQIGSSGDSARIGGSGDCVRIGSSGDYAQIGSSGDYARINCTGSDSVICCAGHGSVVKAPIGCWITLSEWKYDGAKQRCIPVCVKTEYVDGEKIKADTPYKLENGKFVEAQP